MKKENKTRKRKGLYPKLEAHILKTIKNQQLDYTETPTPISAKKRIVQHYDLTRFKYICNDIKEEIKEEIGEEFKGN